MTAENNAYTMTTHSIIQFVSRWAFALMFSAVFLTGGKAMAQAGNPEEVGIIEHLDTIIPSGINFLNEAGDTVDFKSLISKPVILSLIYYDCPGICPALLNGVSDVVEKLDLTPGVDYQLISVSFSTFDTPDEAVEKKKNYLGEKGRNHPDAWQYLTGDSASIRALTNTVGYNFQPVGNDFMHPSCIIILSPEGKVTRYLYGTSYLPFDVKMALVEAQKGQSRPTINRVLEYCFAYDPDGRKYKLQVTKITATIIIFFALVLFITLLVRSSMKKKKKQNQ